LKHDGANNVVDINLPTHVTDNLVHNYNPLSTSHVYYLQQNEVNGGDNAFIRCMTESIRPV